jgi:MinD-like ATPase involved in chromosome partitioning or flagellar assembly
MEYSWRTPLRNYIEKNYIQNEQEWYDLNLSPSGVLNLTIVSERFAGMPLQQRRAQIGDMLQQLQAPTSTGFLSLYTLSEAEAIHLTRPAPVDDSNIYSWHDLATWAANAHEQLQMPQRELRTPQTIAFYSFKGGVGRTTALTHVAAILAMRGRKIVAVDLDLEAPGLSSALNLVPLPQYGIVDYFYERAYLPEGMEPHISVAEIFSEVRLPDAPGRLFVVPAGSLNLDYVAKVDDLRATAVNEQGEDLWSIFYREITEQLEPDIILIDSRTGINEWGAFSLLRAADKAIVFLYPNEQNRQGINLLTRALAGKLSTYFVFSPVPSVGEIGREMVRKQWEAMQADSSYQNAEGEDEESQQDIADPIVIPYLTGIAVADSFPVKDLLSYYQSLANIIDEDTTAISLSSLLTDAGQRRRIIESLTFPAVNAANLRDERSLRDLFQRTADFDRFLEANTCLIRGRKGTGKSALYELLLKHRDVARELANKRLDNVTCFSGHGGFRIRPTSDEFQFIHQQIEQVGSWEAFWRFYLLLRIYLDDNLSSLLKNNKDGKFKSLQAAFNDISRGDGWPTERTQALIGMARDNKLNLLAMDALYLINEQLKKNGRIFWFLYDDLDEDFLEKGRVREVALTGLFRLVQASDARRLLSIRFKIFLREDIWNRLTFDNKSHFNGRDIILQWTRVDFLRLALRQAQQSKEFKDLLDHITPIASIDQADEESLEQALQLLWGSRREQNLKSKYVSRWVYDRLTDSTSTTFPRSLNILLTAAKEYELKNYRLPPAFADRLLMPKSLNEGLLKASAQRCNEIREEYPQLRSFFDSLVNVEMLLSEEVLQELWQKTASEILPTFKVFADFLLSIGLIGFAKSREKERSYRFAEIYTYGFNMSRGRRKY